MRLANQDWDLSLMEGITIKNFDFSFCDFIKHPIASIINDNINKMTNTIKVILKTINRVDETIFSKLFI